MNLTYNKATITGVERHFALFHEIAVKHWAITSSALLLLTKCNSTERGRVRCVNRATCSFGIL